MRIIFLMVLLFSLTSYSSEMELVGGAVPADVYDEWGYVPGSIYFGRVRVHSSQWRYLQLYAGPEGLKNLRIRHSGIGFYSFDTCPWELAVNSSCSIRVEFRPSFPQSYSGNLYIDADGFHRSVWLSGWGEEWR